MERFAREEPYWRAGLYRDVTVVPVVVSLCREPVVDVPYTLVTAQWSPHARDPGDVEQRLLGAEPGVRLSFVALLVDDDQESTTGMVAAVRALPDEAQSLVQPLADRLAGGSTRLTAQRWQRGGRR